MEQLVDNRYEIVEPLGSGGMADVFLAHDSVLDRDVALKVMNSRYASDDEFVERFRREAQSAAALSHPNIVSIYDRGVSDQGTYYIAMEYLSGGTLKDRILKRGPLPPKTAAAVAVQIAEALKAAHDRGMVHRDIKPHNILVTSSGDIKVTDFGIARAASSTTMTKTGAVMGTAHYISPEQAMGESVGPASDLYSLGVLLYEMLTGELPFDADTPIGIAMKHVNAPPRPPREANPEVPAGINAVVVKLLQKDPEDRYASDADLIEDLERTQRGETPAGAASTQVMNRVGPRDNRTQTMPTVPPGQRGPYNRRKEDGNNRRFIPILLLALLMLALVGFGGYSLLQSMGNDDQNQQQTPSEPEVQSFNVSDLTGMTLEQARGEVGERFEVVEGDSQPGPEAANTILEQSEDAGSSLEQGSEIEVTVASGENEVPDTEGDSQNEAIQAIREAGFTPQTEEAESDEDEAGQVLSQDPGGGATQQVGSTITLTVGTGVTTVAVPDIPYGATESEADSILSGVGLTLGSVTETPSNDIAEGGVVSQDPMPDMDVEEGSSVDIVISSGPEQVEVPDVVGDEVNSALSTLGGLGFAYTSAGAESDETAGTVISTDPSGGTDTDAGATIAVTYSLGAPEEPAPVVEEDVVVEEIPVVETDAGDENVSPAVEGADNSGTSGSGGNGGGNQGVQGNQGGQAGGQQGSGGGSQSGGATRDEESPGSGNARLAPVAPRQSGGAQESGSEGSEDD